VTGDSIMMALVYACHTSTCALVRGEATSDRGAQGGSCHSRARPSHGPDTPATTSAAAS